LIVVGVAALALLGGIVALRQLAEDRVFLSFWAIRTFALVGYLCVFVAAVSALYMRELVKLFGRPFVKTHHTVTITGLVLLALHGLIGALSLGANVLVPKFGSLRLFFTWGGPVALYLIGIASLAALFRRSSLKKQWRYVHWLNYIAFLLATTHAIFLGSEFRAPAMKVVPIVLALALVAAFVLKRLQRSKMRSRRRK
jgi:DMSO/TMAO reductase YedYZ heme-binding membrane subunit